MNPRTPVLVGAAQYVGRGTDPEKAFSPADMIAHVAKLALADAGLAETPAIDTIASCRLFADSGAAAWKSPFGSYTNLPWSVAQRIGADPKRMIYGPPSGSSPQMFVNMLAHAIRDGDSEIGLITSGEAMRAEAMAKKVNLELDWGEDAPSKPEVKPDGFPVLSKAEYLNGLALPANIYPIFETAYGAAQGWSIEEHMTRMGALMAPFTEVAAGNKFAQIPVARSAEALTEVTDANRWISWPYPKYMVSNSLVDQAAAVLLMSTAKADELGIAEDKRVYLHGQSEIADKRLPAERADLAVSPTVGIAARKALTQAGVMLGELGPIDIYSCFPVAVELGAQEIGLTVDDPARLTLTGGLPYFGGPGNGYSLHAIAEMVAACRRNPDTPGMIFANGGFLTKSAFGIYSGQPGYGERTDLSALQAEADALPVTPLNPEPSGAGVIDGYTVAFHKGAAQHGVIVGTIEGERFVAKMQDGLDRLMAENCVGQRVSVTAANPANTAAWS
ncbi:MAG: hypothetical protein WA979_14030 [Pacificimonas sp.]